MTKPLSRRTHVGKKAARIGKLEHNVVERLQSGIP